MARAISTSFLLFLAAFALGQADVIVKAPRLRKTMANGVRAVVEQVPGRRFSLQLFFSAKGLDVGVESAGWRHLWEHLAAKGPSGDVDRRLESVGGYLVPNTTRAATRFEINVPADRTDLAFAVAADLLKPRKFSAPELTGELPILQQEWDLTEPDRVVFRAAWTKAYGAARPDPMGSPLGWASASPSGLSLLDRELKSARRVVVTAAGPHDLDATMAKIESLCGSIPTDDPVELSQPIPTDLPAVASSGFIAAKHRNWSHRESWARFVAAQGLRVIDRTLQVGYTPASSDGLILVYGLGLDKWKNIAAEARERASEVISDGRLLALRWASSLRSDASDTAAVNGLLLAESSSASLTQAVELMGSLTDAEISAALTEWLDAKPSVVLP